MVDFGVIGVKYKFQPSQTFNQSFNNIPFNLIKSNQMSVNRTPPPSQMPSYSPKNTRFYFNLN